ncbi:ABC-2 type transport system ATP-binding protein [Atopomonas hussainii]|uniref:ABC-2 type transport system ATP-binding protein n=1 Tax=Atopomonas hussainii TaxID=1429083 RepID=A0A1H7PJB4_9GAMM|nr:ATP-binding cassette domain-containing protein [Atopomonas hussainii]SEL35568.1 ABC-2 type transport system ATP-binding protein [Atopomonas hussainii]
MIEIQQLTKRFAAHTAVDGLSFTVAPGEVLGFLGPNGAGKSTTMKMLTGFLAPTSGTARVFGHDIQRDTLAAQRLIGYLPEGAPCYGDMTVAGFLGFIAEVRGLKGALKRQAVQTASEKVQLESVLNQRIETLSKGFKRRVGLAQAILHDPKVLILDEPTDGLDPNQKHQVRKLIQSLAKDKIVIVSTHILEEVAAVCTRALIIAHGKVVADGTPYELERQSKYHQAVSLVLEQPVDVQPLTALAGVAGVEQSEDGLQLTVLPEGDAVIFPAVNALLAAQNWPVREVNVERGRLDEVFRRLTVGDAA